MQVKVRKLYGHPREHYVNSRVCGIYAISTEIMPYIEIYPETFKDVPVGGMPPEEFFLEQCLNIAIDDGHIINAEYVSQKFIDIDFPWDILFANEKYCLEEVGNLQKNNISKNAKISKKSKIDGYVVIGKDSVIGDNVTIEGNCIIGENTTINNGVIIGENSVIGSQTMINNFCKISSNSVIGNNNKIGFTADLTGVTFDGVSMVHHSQFYGVIGTSTDIAAGCQTGVLRFDDLENPNKVKGKIYTNKYSNASFIGDYTRTGVGNIFLPGVKIGSNSAIGPGVIVVNDINHNKIVTAKQDHNIKDWGPNKYGW